MTMQKVYELKQRLFEPGEIKITAEAFHRLKEAGLEPRQLIERHTCGDWDWSESPARWLVEKSGIQAATDGRHPVSSVYQMYPSESCVSVQTNADFSKTRITNWPDGNPNSPLLNLEAYIRVENVLNPSSRGTRNRTPSKHRGIDR
jgi:hypothetical protein